MTDSPRLKTVGRFLCALVLILLALADSGRATPQTREPSAPSQVLANLGGGGERGQVGTGVPSTISNQTMRNPAAVYCLELGYDFEIVKSPEGGQHGICALPDETTCDAWEFLNGKCGQDYSICALEGFNTVTLKDGKNPFSQEYAVCADSEGNLLESVAAMTNLAERSAGGVIQGYDPLGEFVGPRESRTDPEDPEALDGAAPTSFDWRNHSGSDWTTPVKDQGQCGSCWAFSAVGVSEAVINIASGNPNLDLDLSEQYLVTDCALSAGACDGGSKSQALDYIRDYGIPDEGCLPYLDGDGCTYSFLGMCDFFQCTYSMGGECSDYRCSDRCSDWASRLHTIDSNTYLGSYPSENTMKAALIAHGPLAVSMNMDGSFNPNQVYTCLNNNNTGHAVVVVGYDDAGGYWIVKNSWGDDWGPEGNGYFKVAYNNCAIQKYPYYADASSSCSDPHEANDTPGQATSISYGSTLSDPDICPAGDVDYYSFYANAGDRIVADIDAQAIGSSLDSYLVLYDTDGVTELTHNDDDDGLDSRIGYELPASGTYYLAVRERNHPNEGGTDYSYTISLLECATSNFCFFSPYYGAYGEYYSWLGFVYANYNTNDHSTTYGQYAYAYSYYGWYYGTIGMKYASRGFFSGSYTDWMMADDGYIDPYWAYYWFHNAEVSAYYGMLYAYYDYLNTGSAHAYAAYLYNSYGYLYWHAAGYDAYRCYDCWQF